MPVFCKPRNHDAVIGISSAINYAAFISKVRLRWFFRWKCTCSTETDFMDHEKSKLDFSGEGEGEKEKATVSNSCHSRLV